MIKLRAYHPDWDEFIYSTTWPGHRDLFSLNEQTIIDQFVKLDSCGNEIYSGDIVEVLQDYPGIARKGERGIVEYINTGFMAKSTRPDNWYPIAPYFPLNLNIKVVGNIHMKTT